MGASVTEIEKGKPKEGLGATNRERTCHTDLRQTGLVG